MLKVIKDRHSVRNYHPRQISDIALKEVVEAGREAPSAKNRNVCRLLVIQDKELLDELRSAVRVAFEKEDSYNYDYLAPTLIVVISPKDNYFAYQDASCIMMNMMLEATHQRLGSCWINQLNKFKDDELIRSLLKLEENEIAIASLALGFEDSSKRVKKQVVGNSVSYIK